MKIPHFLAGPAHPRGEDNRPHRRGSFALRWVLATVLAGSVVVALGLAAQPRTDETPSTGAGATPSAAPSAAPGATATEPQTGLRLVHLTTTPDAVSTATRIVAVLLNGPMPHGTARATVLSDEDCDPDAQGYSHCRNDVRLADGTVLHLRHIHRMGMVECLAPGEKVIVEGA